MNLSVVLKNVWKKLDFFDTSFILFALVILLAAKPRLNPRLNPQQTDTVPTFNNDPGAVNMAAAFTQSYRATTTAATVVLTVTDTTAGTNACKMSWYFIFRAGEFTSMFDDECNALAFYDNYQVSSVAQFGNFSNFNVVNPTFTQSLNQNYTGNELQNGIRTNMNFYGTSMKLLTNDASYILTGQLSAHWSNEVNHTFDMYIPARTGPFDAQLFQVWGYQADYIANSMATSISTFAVTTNVKETEIDFILRMAGYTFFVDIIFKILMWVYGLKEFSKQPLWEEEKEEPQVNPLTATAGTVELHKSLIHNSHE
jgi:hypothetical protein